VAFIKGDYNSYTTKRNKYLLETLEPEAMDSFSIGIFSTLCYSKKAILIMFFEDLNYNFKRKSKTKNRI
jgi:hypothetical protein